MKTNRGLQWLHHYFFHVEHCIGTKKRRNKKKKNEEELKKRKKKRNYRK